MTSNLYRRPGHEGKLKEEERDRKSGGEFDHEEVDFFGRFRRAGKT